MDRSVHVLSALAACSLFTVACGTSPEVGSASPKGFDDAEEAAPSPSENALSERERFEAPPLPSDPVLGADNNENHIRDGVERFIDAQWASEPNVWLSQRQVARAYQHLLAAQDAPEQALDGADELLSAFACARAVDPDSVTHRSALLEAIIDNDARTRAYIHFQGQLGGHGFKVPSPGTEHCKFDAEGL